MFIPWEEVMITTTVQDKVRASLVEAYRQEDFTAIRVLELLSRYTNPKDAPFVLDVQTTVARCLMEGRK
jgi:hypothetical protein